ncbi:hypothetical protein Tco_0649021 [Tanacetum coccineum]
MITYLKNMEGWKHKDLKSNDFDSIKELFNKALKRVNMFVDFRTELVEGSSKRAGIELEQEVTKKQKVDNVQETVEVDNDQEAAKIKELMKIVSEEEEVEIDDIPLDVKPPSIEFDLLKWDQHHRLKRLYKVGLAARVESFDNKESLGKDASKQGRIDAIDADEEIPGLLFMSECSWLDKETALSLQAEFDKEEILAREKAKKEEEVNIDLIETWDDIQMFDRAFKKVGERKRKESRNRADEDEVATDAIPLAVKSPTIVDGKIYKEGRKIYYQIMRADGKSQMYMFFSQMLKIFDREDLEDLYKLVKAKYEQQDQWKT